MAVVDIGSNSTRLLIADADRATRSLCEVLRRSAVTRLGAGVDQSGSLSDEAITRVLRTLSCYRDLIAREGADANVAVLTAAVRDADNGAAFAGRVRDDFALDAQVLSGAQEAMLTFLGATHALDDEADTEANAEMAVIDIGGASTELITGSAGKTSFCVSLPLGVVRMSERHIHSDPPEAGELAALAQDVRGELQRGVPSDKRVGVRRAIAVAGTATSAAAIEQQLEPYDPARVHGHLLSAGAIGKLLASTAAMTEARRRSLAGLHPDRAPTIVAGLAILGEALRVLCLKEVAVSEHDILYGAGLRLAGLD